MNFGDEGVWGEGGRGAEAVPGDHAHPDHDHDRNPHGQCAQVVQPFADIEADDIQPCDDGERDERERDIERGVVGEMSPGTGADEKSVAGSKVEYRGEVGKVAGPVGPGGDEPGEVSEGTFAPDVEAALIGVARREFQYGQRQRRVESEPCADPDDDGAGTSGRCGGDPAQADARDDVEEDEVAKSHRLFGPMRILRLSDGDARAEQAYGFR